MKTRNFHTITKLFFLLLLVLPFACKVKPPKAAFFSDRTVKNGAYSKWKAVHASDVSGGVGQLDEAYLAFQGFLLHDRQFAYHLQLWKEAVTDYQENLRWWKSRNPAERAVLQKKLMASKQRADVAYAYVFKQGADLSRPPSEEEMEGINRIQRYLDQPQQIQNEDKMLIGRYYYLNQYDQ